MTLAYAGCRLSEALALTVDRVDLVAGVLTFESLKKRRTGVYRNVPVPPALLDALDLVHGIRDVPFRARSQDIRYAALRPLRRPWKCTVCELGDSRRPVCTPCFHGRPKLWANAATTGYSRRALSQPR